LPGVVVDQPINGKALGVHGLHRGPGLQCPPAVLLLRDRRLHGNLLQAVRCGLRVAEELRTSGGTAVAHHIGLVDLFCQLKALQLVDIAQLLLVLHLLAPELILGVGITEALVLTGLPLGKLIGYLLESALI
jgi:hypothetical protein